MTGKLIAFPATTSDEPAPTTRQRPVRASLASELRPLRRARTERDDGAIAELTARPSTQRIVTATGARLDRREPSTSEPVRREPVTSEPVTSEPVTASRRDTPTMGERLRAGPASSPVSLRELIGEATPLAPDERTTRRPAIRVLVGGQVRFVGWV